MKKLLICMICIVCAAGMISCASAGASKNVEAATEATSNTVIEPIQDILTDEQAIAAVRSFCYANNPDLEEIVKAETYPVYWTVDSSDEQTVVVLFRSYTGALIRYHIDRATGDTYSTEPDPENTSEEVRSQDTINVKDYIG